MRRAVFAIIMIGMACSVAAAQSPYQFGVSAGVMEFDLAGTGVTPIWEVQLDRALTSRWLLGAHVGFARPKQQFGERTTLIIPEAQVQHQWQAGRVLPFAGGAVGSSLDFRQGAGGSDRANLSLSALAGAGVLLTEGFGTRAEFRVRGIGSNFFGSTAEFRGGFFWKF